MTEVYVSEKFELRTELFSEALIEEFDNNSVENSKNLEDIHFCHLVTVEAKTNTTQALDPGDSLVTVGDSVTDETLNDSESELLEMFE